MNQNGGIHKGGFAVLCHRNGGSESPGILNYVAKITILVKIPYLSFLRVDLLLILTFYISPPIVLALRSAVDTISHNSPS